MSLSDAASKDKDCTLTLEELLSSGYLDYTDWDPIYDSAFKAIKDQVKKAFFPEAADLWEDYLTMKELGYTLGDVAKNTMSQRNKPRKWLKIKKNSLLQPFGQKTPEVEVGNDLKAYL